MGPLLGLSRLPKKLNISDLAEFVDINYVSKVTKVNAAALASLALAPASSKNVEMKFAKLESDTNLAWVANSEPDLTEYSVVWLNTDAANWQGAFRKTTVLLAFRPWIERVTLALRLILCRCVKTPLLCLHLVRFGQWRCSL